MGFVILVDVNLLGRHFRYAIQIPGGTEMPAEGVVPIMDNLLFLVDMYPLTLQKNV